MPAPGPLVILVSGGALEVPGLAVDVVLADQRLRADRAGGVGVERRELAVLIASVTAAMRGEAAAHCWPAVHALSDWIVPTRRPRSGRPRRGPRTRRRRRSRAPGTARRAPREAPVRVITATPRTASRTAISASSPHGPGGVVAGYSPARGHGAEPSGVGWTAPPGQRPRTTWRPLYAQGRRLRRQLVRRRRPRTRRTTGWVRA